MELFVLLPPRRTFSPAAGHRGRDPTSCSGLLLDTRRLGSWSRQMWFFNVSAKTFHTASSPKHPPGCPVMSAGSPISWDGLRSLHKLGHRRADQGAECGHGQRDRAAHRGELSQFYLMVCSFSVLSKKSLPNPRSLDFSPLYS